MRCLVLDLWLTKCAIVQSMTEGGWCMAKIAVAVIHGMGAQTKLPPFDPRSWVYSHRLYYALRAQLGADQMDDVIWREIFWADILQDRQDELVDRMQPVQNVGWARKFLLNYIGDAANYQYSRHPSSTYAKIHARIKEALTSLADAVEPETPLIVFAHSLGGHILSSYLWDNNPRAGRLDADGNPCPETPKEAFLRGNTLASFITFGCNIPIFAYSHLDIQAIDPRRWATAGHLRPTWWRNFYTASDILSYPLAPTGGDYTTLGAPSADGTAAQLRDQKIVVGGLMSAWNPASHFGYWDSAGFVDPSAQILREVQAA